MIGVKDKIWSLRQGLFAEYVFALVGLVIFVLAVNGAMETWISSVPPRLPSPVPWARRRRPPPGRSSNRSPNWSGRSAGDPRLRPDAGAAQCRLRPAAQPGGAGQPAHAARRRRPRAVEDVAQRARVVGSNADFSRDIRFTDAVTRGVSFRRPNSAARGRSMSIAVSIPASMPASPSPISIFPSSPISSARSGRQGGRRLCDRSRGKVLATSANGPEVGAGPRQAAAGRVAAEERRRAGVGQGCRGPLSDDGGQCDPEARLVRAVRAADRAGLGADPDQLVRIALLIGSGSRSRLRPACCWRGGC